MVPSGLFCGCPATPIILGMLGPWMSASRSPTVAPIWARVIDRLTAMVDFPTPPLPLATAITCSLLRSDNSIGSSPYCFMSPATLSSLPCLTGRERAQVVRIVETGQDSPLLVHIQFRERGRRHGKLPVRLGLQTEGKAEEELQSATVGHESDGLIWSGFSKTGIDLPDALCHLQQRFTTWWGAVQLIPFPGSQALGILLLDLVVRQTFPASKGHLPQARFGMDMQGMQRRNRLGRLPGALQVAGIECVQGLDPQPLGQRGHLSPAMRAQRDIGLPLKAPLRRPGCSRMSY